ncbi:P-loop containing nucleoside triphosphate hydrolase protein [Xylaria intraflava]|nr:P-loop containing nucleoside triphosphate hydrolase protein [Xylaria intraflava]
MDDPWDWDVDRVVQELCTPHRSWHPSSNPLKFPPLDQLEKALREHEVDGEVLMTYDQSELCAELGMKILKHKSTFKNAIRDIQLRSNQYRLYWKRQTSEFDDDMEDVVDRGRPPADTRDKAASETRIQSPSLNGFGSVPDPKASASEPEPSHDVSGVPERPLKKRKIRPTLVTTEIDPDRNRNIATEADALRFISELAPEFVEEPHEEPVDDAANVSLAGAYLGPKSITRFDIADFTPAGHSEPLLEEDREINFVSAGQLIPGRLIQTHRLVKRRLLRRTGYRRSGFLKSDMVRGSNNPDHDEVLPLYGESDDDMGYDSDTWREIEAERLERDQIQPIVKGLTADEVESTFQRVLARMASEWRTNKLPKCAARANRIWNEARRSGLKDSIDHARRDLHDLEARIAKWKETIEKNEYRNTGELEYSLSTFEPSVFDREHRSWLLSVLTSPTEPAKINRPRRPRERPSKPQPGLAAGEEILTSDSDDSWEDFIVDDELDVPSVADNGPVGTLEEHQIEHTEYSDIVMGDDADNDVSHIEHPQVEAEKADEDHAMSEPMGHPNQAVPAKDSDKNLVTPPNPKKQPVIIDLTTSPDRMSRIKNIKGVRPNSKGVPIRRKGNAAQSPLIMGITDLTSAEQKVANVLMTTDQTYINSIFSIAHFYRPADIWSNLVLSALDREWPKAPYNTQVKKDGLTAYNLIRFFEIHRDDKLHKLRRYKSLDDLGKQRLRDLYKSYSKEWGLFIDFLKRLSDRFEWTKIGGRRKKKDSAVVPTPDAENEKRTDNDSLSNDTDAMSDSGINNDNQNPSPGEQKKHIKKKRKRKEIVRDREAAIAREVDHAGVLEREHRRKLLREKLMTEGSTALGSQQGGIIVNESKTDDQGFIYIDDEIAHRIKDHQITGVRFMWDQLLVANKRQGCLLAHTMGLGKTMQVVTLLATISQAAMSDDPTVSVQVPEEMRESRTLILCPATLVNNWLDEMLGWLPEGHGLGDIFKIDAVLGTEQRRQVIQTWGDRGGVLIIGYNLFKSFIEEGGETRNTLLEWPNIVVADEAHKMKNPNSKTHVAAANFRTRSRIALTGSPLANRVEEYYMMINWVAPNYLGDMSEFRGQYAVPIKDGLHADSSRSQRRCALRMLRVLKSEVAPKVSRITIRALKHDIPPKKEFVITIPLTDVQRKAYEMFIAFHQSMADSGKVPSFAGHELNLICGSTSIFLEKLESNVSGSKDKAETSTLPQQLISQELALLRVAERVAKDDFTLSWKVPLMLEIIGQCKKQGDKVLLFSHSMVTLDYLEGVLRMKKYSIVRLDGQTPMSDRQSIINRFNKGNLDVFLISTKAGSLGLNITGANRVIVFDLQYNPQDEQQAVGRAYRIGQKKPVYVYRLICGGTCEQKKLNRSIWKMQLASRVVDEKHPIPKAERDNGEWDMPTEPKQEDLEQHFGEDSVIDELLRQERYKKGIRAIQMMDIFEEEGLEDAELSAEDVAYADNMIRENEARRAGQPISAPNAAQYAAPPIATNSHILPLPSQPPFTTHLSGNEAVEQAHITDSQALPRPLSVIQNISTNTALAHPLGADATRRSSALGLPNTQPLNDSFPPLAPMQLPGAEVHIRPSGDPSDGTGVSDITFPKIQDGLVHAFCSNAHFPETNIRTKAALDVAAALKDHFQQAAPERQSVLTKAIMHAASAERFIEALCIGLISPLKIVQMGPENIDQQLEAWKELDSSKWEAERQAWRLKQASSDPEHLQTALRRTSMAANQGERNFQPDQSKSIRLDDREALQAVFERRGLKAQKNDQEVPPAVMDHRTTGESPSKEPRLPHWAKKVVRQAQIPAPSSSVQPRMPSPIPRPPARTPFK